MRVVKNHLAGISGKAKTLAKSKHQNVTQAKPSEAPARTNNTRLNGKKGLAGTPREKGILSEEKEKEYGRNLRAGLKRADARHPELPVPETLMERKAGSSSSQVRSGPSPKSVCKTISSDRETYGFRLYPGSVSQTADNPKGLGGMEQLRHFLRAMHGYQRTDHGADIASCSVDSPLSRLLKGETLYMWRDKSETLVSAEKPSGKSFLTLEGDRVRQAQKDVQVWTDDVASDVVDDILAFKSNGRNQLSEQQKAGLEGKAEHVVVRSTIFKTHQADGKLLDAPREHVIYHACYPRLNHGSADQRHFAKGKTGNATLIAGRKPELKARYEKIILQQLRVASANNEDIDLQTPNAFLYGLSHKS